MRTTLYLLTLICTLCFTQASAKSDKPEGFKTSLGPKRWEILEKLKDHKNLKSDLVVFKDGSYIRGEIENIPSLDYPFATIEFERHEIAAILIMPDSLHHARYITKIGENYSSRTPLTAIKFKRTERIQVGINSSNRKKTGKRTEQTSIELEYDKIDYIMLKERARINPLIDEAFYTLKLTNGDRFPILPFTPSIRVASGWEQFSISVSDIVDLEHTRGGLQGYLKGESTHTQLPYSALRDQDFTVTLGRNKQKLTIPWKWIREIQADEGKSIVETDYFDENADQQEDQMVYINAGFFYVGSDVPDTANISHYPKAQGQRYLTEYTSSHVIHPPQLIPTVDSPSMRIDMPAFFIDKYEVTNEEYYNFALATGHRMPPEWEGLKYPLGMDGHPVTDVSYEDAKAYAAWVGKRLPTELEWERAAKGATSFPYPYGPYYDPSLSNTESSGTKSVGSYEYLKIDLTQYPELLMPKAQDLSGNVREWTSSSYTPYWYAEINNRNLHWRTQNRKHTPYKVVRGGAFNSSART
ncbi:hypothetical protein SCG7109_BF_00070, partial [Chlamydiales bacterium SCGC AG-110-M15]